MRALQESGRKAVARPQVQGAPEGGAVARCRRTGSVKNLRRSVSFRKVGWNLGVPLGKKCIKKSSVTSFIKGLGKIEGEEEMNQESA